MGWPAGNKFAANDRRWKKAIENALDKKSKAEGIQALEALAEKLIELALAGNLDALKELGNRIEGKSLQHIDAQVDGGLTVNILRFAEPAPAPVPAAAPANGDQPTV